MISKDLLSIFSFCGEQDGNQGETDTFPTPIVIIDQDSDPDATVVEITFGDRLGALLDTVSHALSKFMLMLILLLFFVYKFLCCQYRICGSASFFFIWFH